MTTRASQRIDPVTLSVIWGGLLSAAAEMGVTLTRTARCSRQAVVIRPARLRPIPGTSRSRCGWRSITSNT